VYINDERQGGSKCGNHTASHLNRYIDEVISPWIEHIDIYMDNAATNKTWTVFAWAYEKVKFSSKISSIRISFMVPGHTKFTPDNLFSCISRTYKNSDVMITDDLVKIITQYAQCCTTSSSQFYDFQDMMRSKFNTIKNIKLYHDFKFVKDLVTGNETIEARVRAYDGGYTDITIQFVDVSKINDNTMATLQQFDYTKQKKSKPLSKEKLVDLEKCVQYVPHEKRVFYDTIKCENDLYGKVAEAEDIKKQVLMDEFTLVEQKLIVNVLKQNDLGAKKAEFGAKMIEYGIDLNDVTWVPNHIKIFAERKKLIFSKVKELQAKYKMACTKALTVAGIKINSSKSRK